MVQIKIKYVFDFDLLFTNAVLLYLGNYGNLFLK